MVIWTSGLQRTVQTAAYVNAAERCQMPLLNEIDSGKLDGLTYEEFADQYPEEFQGREDDKLRYRYPRGECHSTENKTHKTITLQIKFYCPIVHSIIRQKAPPRGCSSQRSQPIGLIFEREHEIVKILTFCLINLFLNQIL